MENYSSFPENKITKLEDKVLKMEVLLENISKDQKANEIIKNEQTEISKDEKLQVFYSTIRQKMGDYIIASKAISSGTIETKANSTAGKIMAGIEIAGNIIPINQISNLVSGIGALGGVLIKGRDEAKIKTSANLFIDIKTGSDSMEKIARKLTLDHNKFDILKMSDVRGVKLYAELVSASIINHMQSGKVSKDCGIEEQLIGVSKDIKPQRGNLKEFKVRIGNLTSKVLNSEAKDYSDSNLIKQQISRQADKTLELK